MNQYPGSRSNGDPDSRSQQPLTGRRFGGGLHGLPATDVAQDPDYAQWRSMNMKAEDSDFVEWQKNRFRAQAGGDTSVGTETGMGDKSSSTGTSPNKDSVDNSNLTGSQESTSAVAPADGSKAVPPKKPD